MKRPVSVLLDVVALFGVPTIVMAVLMLCRVPEDVAGWVAFVLFLVMAVWLFWRFIRVTARWFKMRLLGLSIMLMLFMAATAVVVGLLTPAPAQAKPDRASINFGGCSIGPIKSGLQGGSLYPGVVPPIGSSYAECYHIGHYPMIFMTTNYWFHVRLSWGWTADSWGENDIGQIYNVKNPHLTAHVVQVWWDHLSDRISYDRDVQVIVKPPPPGCPGCLKIRVVGQVKVDALPFLSILARTTHPWVEFVIGPDGQFQSGDYSYAIW